MDQALLHEQTKYEDLQLQLEFSVQLGNALIKRNFKTVF